MALRANLRKHQQVEDYAQSRLDNSPLQVNRIDLKCPECNIHVLDLKSHLEICVVYQKKLESHYATPISYTN